MKRFTILVLALLSLALTPWETPQHEPLTPWHFRPGRSGSSGPVVTSQNYVIGDTLGGGQSIVFTGTGMGAVASVTFGGTAATITGTTPTSVTVTLPAHAAGVVDVNLGGTVLTNNFEYVDPTAFVNAWWEGPDYNAGTGVWTARKGVSASTSGTKPGSGATLGGLQTVNFIQGTTTYLSTGATDFATYATQPALFTFSLVYAVGGGGQYTGWYTDSGGYIGVSATDPSLTLWKFWEWRSGAGTQGEDVPIVLLQWKLYGAKSDGVKMYTRVDGAASWSAGTSMLGVNSGPSGPLLIGLGSIGWNGRIAIFGLGNSPPNDANYLKMVGAINQRWGTTF